MQIDATTVQQALVALGHDPGPIDGRIGRRTLAALDPWLDSLHLPTVSYTTISGGEALDVTPDVVGDKLVAAAAQYEPPPPRLPTTRSSSASTTTSPGAITTVFWRVGNPWAWAAVLVPLSLLLGGVGFYFLRSPQRGRR